MTTQGNTDYREVASTIEILNKDVVSRDGEYIFDNQSIHRLAHEYYEGNYNTEYKSELSPQVANILHDKLSKKHNIQNDIERHSSNRRICFQ